MKEDLKQSGVGNHPVLILTIANGAGHTRVAGGIAAAIRAMEPSLPVIVVDVSEYMTTLARFTHVSTFLWLVKHAPAVWDRIDRHQKRQTHTSPEWFYRHGCHRLFDLARRVRPRALIATEVGCCEIAALIKRGLELEGPLVAVNDDYDADRAWVQPEVDLYCFMTDELGEQLVEHGANRAEIVSWGAALSTGYEVPRERNVERAEICNWLWLDPELPIVLIAGGGEGIGKLEDVTSRLLRLNEPVLQLIVLTGRNDRLKSRCKRIAENSTHKCRVLGWVGPEQMPKLMWAADLMVSKLGSMFHEAIAAELPIIAMEPPPGAERVQFRLLEDWKVGCAVRSVEEVVGRLRELLLRPHLLEEMRRYTRAHQCPDVSRRIAQWLVEATRQDQIHSRNVANII